MSFIADMLKDIAREGLLNKTERVSLKEIAREYEKLEKKTAHTTLEKAAPKMYETLKMLQTAKKEWEDEGKEPDNNKLDEALSEAITEAEKKE